jgi:2-keto-3-deoxy-L-rhamnonate aldolase RhmA
MVAGACGAKKVPVGIFAASLPVAAKALDDGYTLVCAGIDIGLYSRSAAEIARGLKPINP